MQSKNKYIQLACYEIGYQQQIVPNITSKQEMSQSRDECPQRNWSCIRHIRGKLAVI